MMPNLRKLLIEKMKSFKVTKIITLHTELYPKLKENVLIDYIFHNIYNCLKPNRGPYKITSC